MDGAIRNQLLALLGNALAGGGGDAGVFPMIGGGDAGVFPMSAGNWLQLVTAAATGNSQQLFSTLAGNAIRNNRGGANSVGRANNAIRMAPPRAPPS